MLIQADASQLEWRTLLYLSQDPVGLKELLEGQDTHTNNQIAFELPSRLIAKIYLFRTIFRGSGWSFANDPDFQHVSSDPKYWDGINEKFFAKYNVIDQCHKAWADDVLQGRPICGPFARSWTIPLRTNERTGELKIPWTTLTNYPVQGTGADIMMVARISFWNRLQKLNLPDVKIISTVHDSIVLDYKDEAHTQTLVNLFHQVFDDLPSNFRRLFGTDWNVPLDCECKIGVNMKDMTKVKRNDLTK